MHIQNKLGNNMHNIMVLACLLCIFTISYHHQIVCCQTRKLGALGSWSFPYILGVIPQFTVMGIVSVRFYPSLVKAHVQNFCCIAYHIGRRILNIKLPFILSGIN